MATAKRAPEPSPTVKRLLGEGKALTDASRRKLGHAAKDESLQEEITGVNHRLDELTKQMRAPQPSTPELSVRAPGGFRLRLSDVPPWVLVVALTAVVLVVWLLATR